MRGQLIVDDYVVLLAIAVEVHAVSAVSIGLLGLEDLLHEIQPVGFLAEEVGDAGEVTKLDVELDERSEVACRLARVDLGLHPLVVEQHRKARGFLGVYGELVVSEEPFLVALDDLGDHALAVLLEGLREDGLDDSLVGRLGVGSVGGAEFQVGDVDVFGEDMGTGAEVVSHFIC